METIRNFKALPTGQHPVFCAIGMFDGLHIGHQSVLRNVIAQAKDRNGISIVLTFQEHPAELLAPDRSPKLIYPPSFKETLLEEMGIDIAWVIPFDKDLSLLSAEDFLQKVMAYTGNLRGISVGSNFTFGHQRQGNVDLIKACGVRNGFQVDGKPSCSYGDELVSSTRIRSIIRSGDLQLASKLLGRPYRLIGRVFHGDGLGRKLGFPTANINIEKLEIPPLGVYAITCEIDGKKHNGVLNIGNRPTLNQPLPKLQVEAHFWDIDLDLYGKQLALEIKGRLRDERRFPSVDDLKLQIHKDIENAKSLLT